jgi:hypothetical protein
MAWWNTSYLFRQEIVLTAPAGTSPIGSSVNLDASHLDLSALVANATMRSDLEDIEIIYETDDATPSHTVLGRDASVGSNFVNFETNVEIPDTGKFYMYYGNPDLDNQPTRPASGGSGIVVLADDPGVAYTRPGEHWINSQSIVQGARATFAMITDSIVSIVLATGPDRGKAIRHVDDGLAIGPQVVDLYSGVAGTTTLAVVFLNTAIARHSIAIEVAGDKNPSSADHKVEIVSFGHNGGVDETLSPQEINIDTWTSYIGGGA